MAPNEVDRTIHDRATGVAASTAARHQDEKPLKLYAGWFCPFVQRTWITLEEKGIDYQYIEINPYHKDPDFLKLNPRGLVPTLGVPVPLETHSTAGAKINGSSGTSSGSRKLKPLYESVVLAEYLDEHYSDIDKYGPRLLPSGDDSLAAYERARCRLWIDHISSRIVPGFYRFLQHTPDKPYSIEEAREQFLGHIATFFREVLELDQEGQELAFEPGPWFLGKKISLVDVTLVPWVLRLFLIDHYKPGGVGIPDQGKGGEDEAVWGRFRTWESAVKSHPSITNTMSDHERYIDVYKRYAEDKTGSQVGQATRGGTGLP